MELVKFDKHDSKESIEIFVKNVFPEMEGFSFIEDDYFVFEVDEYMIDIFKATDNYGDFWKGKISKSDGRCRSETMYTHNTLVDCILEVKQLLDARSEIVECKYRILSAKEV